MVIQIGQLIHHDRYRIEALMGQGGMGAVYQAYDSSLHMDVAIKENFETTFEAQRQFEREANILAHLSHPNLPRVTDYFFIPNQGQYLVMDYVAGEDLLSMTHRLVRLPEPEVLTWIGQIAEALAYLHSQDPPIIHRDIKPSNIRIRPDGRAMLVDFGIAKIYDVHLATTIGAKAVTPGYSPPEQYGGGSTDTRSDIYALGATIFHLLTGQTPPDSLSRAVNSAVLPPPRQVNPQISPQMEQIVLKAVEIPTERRYQNVGELSRALQNSKPAASTVAAAAASAVAVSASQAKPAGEYATKVVAEKENKPNIPEKAAAVQTVAVPYPGTIPVDSAAPLSNVDVSGSRPRVKEQPKKKFPAWIFIAGGLLAACLIFSITGVGLFSLLRGRLGEAGRPSATSPSTVAAAVNTAALAVVVEPTVTVTLPNTALPTVSATQKTTDYSATNTQIVRVRQTTTAQAGLKTTQQAQHLSSAIQALAEKGEISDTNGTFYAVDDSEKEVAKINYFDYWETGYSAEDFAIEADIAYDVASDKANWFNTGCGFVFSEKDDSFYHFLKLSLDGMATLRTVQNQEFGMIMQRKYGQPSIPKGEMHVFLVVKDDRVYLYIDDEPVFDVYAPRLIPGDINLSLSSGINTGFGTRCNFSNVGLWIFE